MVLAVLVDHIVDHLAAAVHAEIHVDVGHRDPLGVQKPLEQQVVHQGIEVGDPQRVGDEAAGG